MRLTGADGMVDVQWVAGAAVVLSGVSQSSVGLEWGQAGVVEQQRVSGWVDACATPASLDRIRCRGRAHGSSASRSTALACHATAAAAGLQAGMPPPIEAALQPDCCKRRMRIGAPHACSPARAALEGRPRCSTGALSRQALGSQAGEDSGQRCLLELWRRRARRVVLCKCREPAAQSQQGPASAL